jgi:hypothetical protein
MTEKAGGESVTFVPLGENQLRQLVDADATCRKADPTFRVRRDQLQTAVNDTGFAVQVGHGEQLASSRHFQHLVVATTGEMATMRTVHPLDFIRLKTKLSRLRDRDPRKAPKDRLQAKAVQQLWDEYLLHLEVNDTGR